MKVCILPNPKEFKSDIGGVPRVIADLTNYLPEMGIEVVADPADADIVHGHATTEHPHMDVYTNHAYWQHPKTSWEKIAVERMDRNLVRAKIITSVSDWTPQLYEKKLGVTARIIHNGVPLQSIRKTPKGRILKEYGLKKPFFLWSKNLVRRLDACRAAVNLAVDLPEHPFVMTVIPHGIELPPNLIVTGTVPYKKMKMMLKDCLALIATEKECFSIQNIEAMALGKPIIGWDHGGTPEVVKSGVNGYLVPVGEELINCIPPLLQNYKKWSKNAWRMAEDYDLQSAILPQYIKCYHDALADLPQLAATIVVTCYNKAAFIERAVVSALSQEFTLPFEVIVVDDCSTDGSQKILRKLQKRFPELQLILNKKNINAGATRQKGVEASHGEYIACLDGDDWIEPNFLATLYPVIHADRTIGIAYSDFRRFGQDLVGGVTKTREWDYNELVRHNFVPCCSLFRKEAWRKAGGYHGLSGWGDYDLWLGIGGKGYRGVHVPEVLFHYFEQLDNRAFRSSLNAGPLRTALRSFHPDYIGPTVEEIKETEKYLAARKGEVETMVTKDKAATGAVKVVLTPISMPEVKPIPKLSPTRLRYLGEYTATIILFGDASRQRYKFSKAFPEFEVVDERDIDGLLANIGWFERV